MDVTKVLFHAPLAGGGHNVVVIIDLLAAFVGWYSRQPRDTNVVVVVILVDCRSNGIQRCAIWLNITNSIMRNISLLNCEVSPTVSY